MRRIWATASEWPHSQDILAAAVAAGAVEIITIPCPTIPSLVAGYNEIDDNPVPDSVTPRQARLALSAAGLLDTVDAAVAAADKATQITWDYATEIRSDNPLIWAVASGLTPPLTREQISDLFRTAATF